MEGTYIVSSSQRTICYLKKTKEEALLVKKVLEKSFPATTFYIGCCNSEGYVYWKKPVFPTSK